MSYNGLGINRIGTARINEWMAFPIIESLSVGMSFGAPAGTLEVVPHHTLNMFPIGTRTINWIGLTFLDTITVGLAFDEIVPTGGTQDVTPDDLAVGMSFDEIENSYQSHQVDADDLSVGLSFDTITAITQTQNPAVRGLSFALSFGRISAVVREGGFLFCLVSVDGTDYRFSAEIVEDE